jgi:D-glycero-D-manno-heptose 1,7-bisphosphate phosphatase
MQLADAALESNGVWRELFPETVRGGAALFLDRDGVVVEDTEYLCRVEDVALIPGAAATVAAANRRKVPVVLVTNQAGIGRGYYGWDAFAAVQRVILSNLASQGARIDAVYACALHPRGKGRYAHPDPPDRKPRPGMLLRAAADLGIDLTRSWLIGDKSIDIEAAKRAGLAGAMQVMTGYGAKERPRSAILATADFDVRFGQSIASAITLPILGNVG